MKKQILINGEKSDWYEKAIFVLKDGVGKAPLQNKLSLYADELIEMHLKRQSFRKRQANRKVVQQRINLFFSICVVSALIAIMLLIIRLIN